jgi:hypothetical protein
MTTLTSKQKKVFDKYFETRGDQHLSKYDNIYIGFFEYVVSRETDIVLEIKVKDTVITMWKRVKNLSVTIL